MSAVVCQDEIKSAEIIADTFQNIRLLTRIFGEVLIYMVCAVRLRHSKSCKHYRAGGGVQPQSFDIKNAHAHIAQVTVRKLGRKIWKGLNVMYNFHIFSLLKPAPQRLIDIGDKADDNKIDCRGAVYFVQKGYFGFEIMRLSGGITTVLLYKIFARKASVYVKKK